MTKKRKRQIGKYSWYALNWGVAGVYLLIALQVWLGVPLSWWFSILVLIALAVETFRVPFRMKAPWA